ncbi:MAG: peptide ABC transporter substrate-binding protein [Bacillota bacterium]|nr:MAG: peptide ABC transporter substrate-binding protein [Bacillota bacterium]
MRLGIVAAVFLLLASCWTASAQVDKDTIVVGITSDIVNLDPHNFRHRDTETVLRNIYDGLVTRGPDMQPVPELAESITQIDDTTWEFKLRRGVKFHDGTEMTAHDVAFSINRYVREGAMGGQTSPRKDLLGPVTHADPVDDYTVRVYLSQPWSVFLPYLVHHMVVPASVGDGLVEHPIGAGPFKFVEWVRGSHIVLERFDDYYGGAPDLGRSGPAPAKRVIFRVIPENATRLAALMAGEIDIMAAVPVHAVPDIQRHPNLELRPVMGTRSYFTELNVRRPPFDDKRVRQAMNYAIDVNLVIDRLLDGLGQPLSTVLSPLSFGHNDDLVPYPYDPDKARQLLAEAGYPNGFTFELSVEDRRRDVAEAYAFMLSQIGVTARVRVWGDYNSMVDAMRRGELDAMMTDWGDSTMDPTGIFVPKLRTGDRGNYGGYSNPEVDRLIELAESTSDPRERATAYRAAQAIVYEDAPMIFEYITQELYAQNRALSGWDPIPDSRINLHTAVKQ